MIHNKTQLNPRTIYDMIPIFKTLVKKITVGLGFLQHFPLKHMLYKQYQGCELHSTLQRGL